MVLAFMIQPVWHEHSKDTLLYVLVDLSKRLIAILAILYAFILLCLSALSVLNLGLLGCFAFGAQSFNQIVGM